MGDDIETLRERLHLSLVQQRKSARQERVSARRSELDREGDSSADYTDAQIIEIIHKIRKQASVSANELDMLRVHFSKKENVPIFFKYLGALHGLVGEMTGSDTCKQILAAECLCHLTLGSSSHCLSIAKSAGVYLMAFLADSNIPLAEVCGLTLGNMACNSPKACEVLKEQGLLKTLISLLNSSHEEIRSSVTYALSHALKCNPCIIRAEELYQVVVILSDFSNCTRHQARLLFITSSIGSILCPAFAEYKIFTKALDQIETSVSEKEWEKNHAMVVYLLRTAANIVCDETILSNEKDALLREDFVSIIRKLLVCQRQNVISNILWLLGNLENHKSLTRDWKRNYFNKYSDLLPLCV